MKLSPLPLGGPSGSTWICTYSRGDTNPIRTEQPEAALHCPETGLRIRYNCQVLTCLLLPIRLGPSANLPYPLMPPSCLPDAPLLAHQCKLICWAQGDQHNFLFREQEVGVNLPNVHLQYYLTSTRDLHCPKGWFGLCS